MCIRVSNSYVSGVLKASSYSNRLNFWRKLRTGPRYPTYRAIHNSWRGKKNSFSPYIWMSLVSFVNLTRHFLSLSERVSRWKNVRFLIPPSGTKFPGPSIPGTHTHRRSNWSDVALACPPLISFYTLRRRDIVLPEIPWQRKRSRAFSPRLLFVLFRGRAKFTETIPAKSAMNHADSPALLGKKL